MWNMKKIKMLNSSHFVTCTVFSCWVCNVVTWLPTTGFSSDLVPRVTTLNCGAWDLASPTVCETPGLLPVWGNWSTMGCPDLPIAVTKSFCPSCLMTWGEWPADFAASDAWDEATLLRMIWRFAGEIVNGAVSFCNPLVVTLVPVTLSVVFVEAVEVAKAGLMRRADDVLEFETGSGLLGLRLSVESVATEVVIAWAGSVKVDPEQRVTFCETTGASVSIGTDASSLGSDLTVVPSGWEWGTSSIASVSMISSGSRLLSSGDTTSMLANSQLSGNPERTFVVGQSQTPVSVEVSSTGSCVHTTACQTWFTDD